MMRRFSVLLLGSLLASCGTVSTQPADPKVVADIQHVCLNSGLFKLAGDGISLIPGASLPVRVVEAGVDKVCADPTKFANDISTVEWLLKNLSTVRRQVA